MRNKAVSRIYICTIAILMIALLNGCQNDILDHYEPSKQHQFAFVRFTSEDKEAPYGSRALVFSSENELFKMLAYNDQQKKEFSNKNNFKSFAAISDEVYDLLYFENFTNIEEIGNFVETYSDYLEIVTDNEGELHVYPKLFKNPFKHVVNEDRVFFIGDTVYMAVGKELLRAPKSKFTQLRNLDDSNYLPEGIEKYAYVYKDYNIDNYTDFDKPEEYSVGLRASSTCNSWAWVPSGLPLVSNGYIQHVAEWEVTENKDMVGYYFSITLSYDKALPYAQVYAKRKFLVWYLEKHTLNLTCNVQVIQDYSGTTSNYISGFHYVKDDYSQTKSGLEKYLDTNFFVIPYGWVIFRAGTMNYNFYGKSAAVSQAININKNSYTGYFRCIDTGVYWQRML